MPVSSHRAANTSTLATLRRKPAAGANSADSESNLNPRSTVPPVRTGNRGRLQHLLVHDGVVPLKNATRQRRSVAQSLLGQTQADTPVTRTRGRYQTRARTYTRAGPHISPSNRRRRQVGAIVPRASAQPRGELCTAAMANMPQISLCHIL